MTRFVLILSMACIFLGAAGSLLYSGEDKETDGLVKKCTAECAALKGNDCGAVDKAAAEYVTARRTYHTVGDERGYYHPTGSYWYQELLNLSLVVEQKKRVLKPLCPKTMLKEQD